MLHISFKRDRVYSCPSNGFEWLRMQLNELIGNFIVSYPNLIPHNVEELLFFFFFCIRDHIANGMSKISLSPNLTKLINKWLDTLKDLYWLRMAKNSLKINYMNGTKKPTSYKNLWAFML